MSKSFKLIDIAKFIMAILVVGIHAHVPIISNYFGRMAVPYFFIASAFLFYIKVESVKSADTIKRIKKFVRRSTELYLIWLIIYSPFVIKATVSSFNNPIIGLRNLLVGIFTGYWMNFPQAWYLVASIGGLYVTSILIKFFSDKVNIMLFLVLLSFFGVAECFATSGNFKVAFLILLRSFIRAILFFYVGFGIAKYLNKLSIINPYKTMILTVFLMFMVVWLQLAVPNATVLPFDTVFWPIIAGTVFVLSVNRKLNNISVDTIFFRNASTFIFVSHFLIIKLLSYLLPFRLAPVSIMSITVFLSVLAYLYLKKFKFIRFLI